MHAIVPGSGPSRDGLKWKECRTTQKRRGKKPKPLLVDYEKLGRRFRDEYLAGLRRLLASGKLKVQDRPAAEQLFDELATIDWAVYIQPPPKQSSRAEHVVRYLARYMTGGPISDKRLIRLDQHDNVWFWARSKDKSGGREQVHLPAIGFVQQWSLHVLPRGYTKVRSFGQWAYTQRAAYQQLCEQLKPKSPQPSPQVRETNASGESEVERKLICPVCRQQGVDVGMQLIDFQRRPSWRELFYGPDHPEWLERVHLPAPDVVAPQPRGSPQS